MPTAKKDDINIVEIESEGYNQEKVRSSVKILQIQVHLCLGLFGNLESANKFTLIRKKANI